MSDQPYSNRELNLMFGEVKNAIADLKEDMNSGFKGVHSRQDKTNGKVRKIIVALVFAFGLILGIGAKDFGAVIEFLM